MRFALFVILATLACTAPASAIIFEINGVLGSDPRGIVHGSFFMDDQVGPTSIADVQIHTSLPLTAGPVLFDFNRVFYPTDTWRVGYLWFGAQGYGAGDTHFFMFIHPNAALNDGSYSIGTGFNAHQSEISIIGVNNWQGIVGQMTVAVPGPIVGAGLPGLAMAIAGFIGWRRSRRVIAA